MAAQWNAHYEKLGYPLVTEEEDEDIANTFSALADPESFSGSIMADTPGPEFDTKDPFKNIYYINFNPETDKLSQEVAAQLSALQENVKLNNQFMDTKANAAVKQKIANKDLVDAETPTSNYKAKVLIHLTANAPWTAGFAMHTLNKDFSVEKKNFHETLVSYFTDGLNLPPAIHTKLEGILQNMQKTIKESTDHNKETKENLMFFILMTTYQFDDVVQRWTSVIRTIYLRVNQDLSTYVKEKKDKSSGYLVNVAIEYARSDGAFNDKLFEQNAKASIQTIVSGETKSFIESTIDVSV
ncbi:hypothetical protein N0V85_008339 [Neurospora sp. IMI 360204]|nr:hypothetical protein N0V85_008339 [Neurospora sp. IMI 360204]